MRKTLFAVAASLALAWTAPAFAHCDTLDGPVVSSARKALDTGNINYALVWVQKKDEGEIRSAFERTRKNELADTKFFETLVRVHRAGEGADFDGLKPAGHVEPPVAAADKAIETGKLQPLAKLVKERVEKGLHSRYDTVMAKKNYAANDVDAGREYVAAYVDFTHYAERVHDAAGAPAQAHEHKEHAH
jgi:hypothetical protein